MWPDVEIKSNPVFPKVSKSILNSVSLKDHAFKIGQKSPFIWTAFERKIVFNNFHKPANLIALAVALRLPYYMKFSFPDTFAWIVVWKNSTKYPKWVKLKLGNQSYLTKVEQTECPELSMWLQWHHSTYYFLYVRLNYQHPVHSTLVWWLWLGIRSRLT